MWVCREKWRLTESMHFLLIQSKVSTWMSCCTQAIVDGDYDKAHAIALKQVREACCKLLICN